MLTIQEYGVLATLFSITYIISVFNESIQMVIAKYAAKENDKGKIKNIIMRALRKSFFVSILVYGAYLFFAFPLSKLLDIDYPLVALSGAVIFVVFFSPINRGVMQGKERFYSLGSNVVIDSFGKLIFSMILVWFGWSVYGAITGLLLGGVVAIAFSFLSVGIFISSKEKRAEIGGIYDYSRPVFIATLVITAFYSLDIVFARLFFSEEIVGIYAVASILSKAIFWGTHPISRAMFPFSANGQRGKRNRRVFINSLVILLFFVVGALLIFSIFSDLIVMLFVGGKIPLPLIVLINLGIGMGILAVTNLFVVYKLSMGEVKGTSLLFVFLLLEGLLFYIMSFSLESFSIAYVISSVMFLMGSILLLKNENSYNNSSI